MKITIFMYNDKYIIEMEGGPYKQTYKISADSVSGPEQVKTLCTTQLIESTMQRFNGMHSDFAEAYKTMNNT